MDNPVSIWVTRSRLVEVLQDNGIRHEGMRENILAPGKLCWKFTVSPKLVEIVSAYYGSIGKPVPQSFQNAFKEGGARA